MHLLSSPFRRSLSDQTTTRNESSGQVGAARRGVCLDWAGWSKEGRGGACLSFGYLLQIQVLMGHDYDDDDDDGEPQYSIQFLIARPRRTKNIKEYPSGYIH